MDPECRGGSQGGGVVDPDCRGGTGDTAAVAAPDRGRRRRLLDRERRGWWRSGGAWLCWWRGGADGEATCWSGRGGGRASSSLASARQTGSRRHESSGRESSPRESARIGAHQKHGSTARAWAWKCACQAQIGRAVSGNSGHSASSLHRPRASSGLHALKPTRRSL